MWRCLRTRLLVSAAAPIVTLRMCTSRLAGSRERGPGQGPVGSPMCVAARPRPGSAGLAGDQVVGEQEDGSAGDGGKPGGGVEEAVQGVDVEDLGGGPAAAQGSDDADQAGEDEA